MSPTAERPCLTEEEALAHVAGRSDGDAQRIAHLETCDRCRMLLAEAARGAVTATAPLAEGNRYDSSGRPLTLTPGEVLLGRYEIVRFIARGGMGEVYQAHDSVLDETVAVKTLVCTDLDDRAARQRFMAEVRLARQVSHPNVCRIHECGFHRPRRSSGRGEDEVPFLTMQFLQGETLDARISRSGRLEPAYAAELLGQMTAGLSAIHAAGIVHRDIKPHNMLLLPGSPERLVLTDFGLARALEPSAGSTSQSVPRLMGTVDYMAPEQMDGEPPTPAMDIYALGVVIFEMLTGERPFRGSSPLSSALERVQRPPPRASERLPGLDRRWDALISRCLALDPRERFSRVEEVSLEGAGVATLGVAGRRRRRRFALTAASGVALVAAAVAARALLVPAEDGVPAETLTAPGPPRPVSRVLTASGCSAEMVRVPATTGDGPGFCIDRYEAAAVDDVEERLLSPFYPPSSERLHAVLVDWTRRIAEQKAGRPDPLPELPRWQRETAFRPRAVSRKGIVPQGYTSQVAAAQACASAGKRLCTTEEWTRACRGEGGEGRRFPYGASYQAGACNIGREDHPAFVLHGDFSQGLLDPRMNRVSVGGQPLLRPTGATPGCTSRWGDDAIHDMVGNLDEWSADSDGTLLGGFYSRESEEGCEARITKHGPSYFNYSTGFRCCADAGDP